MNDLSDIYRIMRMKDALLELIESAENVLEHLYNNDLYNPDLPEISALEKALAKARNEAN